MSICTNILFYILGWTSDVDPRLAEGSGVSITLYGLTICPYACEVDDAVPSNISISSELTISLSHRVIFQLERVQQQHAATPCKKQTSV